MSKRETITATVRKIVYPRSGALAEFTGFAVFKTDRGTVVGEFAWLPKLGQTFDFFGRYQHSPKHHGEQFKAESATLIVPTDPRDLLAYAASITAGIGPAKEAEIWLRYGNDWQSATDLDQIAGIRPAARKAWRETLQRIVSERDRSQAIAYLLGIDCTPKMAEAAWQRWERDTIGIVSGNPYNLAALPHFGFHDVDTGPRLALKIADEDPRRHDAATLYALGTITASGNTIATTNELALSVARLIGLEIDLPTSLLRLADQIVDLGKVVAKRRQWIDAATIIERIEASPPAR